MANSIKYLTYNVKRDGETISSGTIPAILATGGSNKDYDLSGIWLSRTGPMTKIEFSDGVKTITSYSDRHSHEWLEYLEKLNTGIVNDIR